MENEEKTALADFDKLTRDSNGDMQEYVNMHRSYCRTVAILANVRYLYLLLNNYYDAPIDDRYKLLDKMYQNRDLMEEDK